MPINLRSAHAAKLGRCQTSAEYHRLLVVTRCKTKAKAGMNRTRPIDTYRKPKAAPRG